MATFVTSVALPPRETGQTSSRASSAVHAIFGNDRHRGIQRRRDTLARVPGHRAALLHRVFARDTVDSISARGSRPRRASDHLSEGGVTIVVAITMATTAENMARSMIGRRRLASARHWRK